MIKSVRSASVVMLIRWYLMLLKMHPTFWAIPKHKSSQGLILPIKKFTATKSYRSYGLCNTKAIGISNSAKYSIVSTYVVPCERARPLTAFSEISDAIFLTTTFSGGISSRISTRKTSTVISPRFAAASTSFSIFALSATSTRCQSVPQCFEYGWQTNRSQQ